MDKKIPVAVLAATGSVGQRFVQLLDGHPWFEVVALTGSERSVGKDYGLACRWMLAEPMPVWAQKLEILPNSPGRISLPLVFSALPADVARDVEPEFARGGSMVCSNASAYRMAEDVPILLPEVNADHVGILAWQRDSRNWSGGIVTNSNCTSTGMTVALKALQTDFGVDQVLAVSLQALSGAGYPGVASLDIIDNVIPFIGGEEAKVESEPCKMLGAFSEGRITPAVITISAHTNRVAVSDGHTVCLNVKLHQRASVEDVIHSLVSYQGPNESRNLPSAPVPVIRVCSQEDRPQPRLDRMAGKGMTTVVGRVRKDTLLDFKCVVLSHNTIRGAAGGSIYNAELLAKTGWINGLSVS
jgi:aspartate-semialdehyde dehydrogenase